MEKKSSAFFGNHENNISTFLSFGSTHKKKNCDENFKTNFFCFPSRKKMWCICRRSYEIETTTHNTCMKFSFNLYIRKYAMEKLRFPRMFFSIVILHTRNQKKLTFNKFSVNKIMKKNLKMKQEVFTVHSLTVKLFQLRRMEHSKHNRHTRQRCENWKTEVFREIPLMCRFGSGSAVVIA